MIDKSKLYFTSENVHNGQKVKTLKAKAIKMCYTIKGKSNTLNWVPFAFGKANPIAKQEHELKELICEHIKKNKTNSHRCDIRLWSESV